MLVYLCYLFVTSSETRSSSFKESSPRARRIVSGLYIMFLFPPKTYETWESEPSAQRIREEEKSLLSV